MNITDSAIYGIRLFDDAYRDAKIRFRAEMSQDLRKFSLVESRTCCQEVRDLALKAMNRYNSSRSDSRVKLWLHSFAQNVTFYGGVIDVLVQHHPEFVSLAWGAMKLLFTVSHTAQRFFFSHRLGLTRLIHSHS